MHAKSIERNDMTQMVINISDRSLVPELKKVLGRMGGIEHIQVIRPTTQPSKRKKFLAEFTHAVSQAKDFKEGKTEFSTWEEMMDEL